MHPVAGQPPSFGEALLAVLVICLIFLFLLGLPIVAIVVVLLGIAGTLISALFQPAALSILFLIGIALIIALVILTWVDLLLEMPKQFGTLGQALGTSARAISRRGRSHPHHQQPAGGIAPSLAQEPSAASQRKTRPLPEEAVGDNNAGNQQEGPTQRAPGGIVGWGERVEAAQWETRPKEDQSDPIADTDQIALPADKFKGQWAIVGSSRIGRSHEYDGKYREDSLGGAIIGSWQVAAVADGGGSYKLARIGAREATQAAIGAMRQQIEQRKGSVPAERDAQAFIASVLFAGIRAGYQAIHDEAEQRQAKGQQVTVKDLRTTLLLLTHCESHKPKGHWVGGIQVGDGIIVARDGKGQLHWLGDPDTGPTGNEVLFLTDVENTDEEWEKRKRIAFIESEPLHCLAMTDGVSDDFLPTDKNLGTLEKPLYGEALPRRSPSEAAQALATLMSYDRSGSFDDRTLVCIYKAG